MSFWFLLTCLWLAICMFWALALAACFLSGILVYITFRQHHTKAKKSCVWVTCNHVNGHMRLHSWLCKQRKSHNQKSKTLLFKSYSNKNTFSVIINISTSPHSTLKFKKFCHPVMVEGDHIYQFWVPEMSLFEMWRQRGRRIKRAESAYINLVGSWRRLP